MITYCTKCNNRMNDDGFLMCKGCRKKEVVERKQKDNDDVNKLINLFGGQI